MTTPTPKGEKMTAAQRADKMIDEVNDLIARTPIGESGTGWLNLMPLFERHLKAAEDAARAEGYKAGQAAGCLKKQATPFHTELMKLGIEEGFAEAVEKAAKTAESYLMIGATMMNPQFEQIAKNTAEQIRALRPSGSGEESK